MFLQTRILRELVTKEVDVSVNYDFTRACDQGKECLLKLGLYESL